MVKRGSENFKNKDFIHFFITEFIKQTEPHLLFKTAKPKF